MKKKFIKGFLNKLILLTLLLLAPITSSAEIGQEKWAKECTKDNKKNCFIAINNAVAVPGSDEKQTLATVIIQLGTTTERKMDLVDGEEQTYKLKEKNKLVPVLTVRFPLNVDLKKQPLIQIDKKKVLNIPFSHCNAQQGCVAQAAINDDVINLFKSGKELTLIMGVFASKDNMVVKLPLKGFTKSYNSLLK